MSRGEMTTSCSLELTRARVLWEDDQAKGARRSLPPGCPRAEVPSPARSGRFREADGPDRQQLADLRRSELHRQLHLEPSDISAHLYRISTEHNSNDAKRLFLRTFPAYPEIIQNSRRRFDQDESAGLLAHSLA